MRKRIGRELQKRIPPKKASKKLTAVFFIYMLMMVLLMASGCGADGEAVSAAAQEEEETVEEVLLPVERIPKELIDAGTLDRSKFVRNGHRMSYEDQYYRSEQGIDVSGYNGEIDWERVKASGIEFAFIRLGYRGYTEGGLNLDSRFEENIQGALSAGLKVGVYFFAQAINEEEAREEADFVLEHIRGYKVVLPVVYDPEDIQDEARTDGISKEQFTANTLAFCKRIEEAGYEPAIYCNAAWQAWHLDMTQLTGILTWYADFTEYPQSSYHFEIWQYSNKGRVDGIAEDLDVDMDIRILPKRYNLR